MTTKDACGSRMVVSLHGYYMAPLQRDQLFQLRMTAEEKQMLGELADAAGFTSSDYVRSLIRAKHTEFRTKAAGFGPVPKKAQQPATKPTRKK